MAGKQIGIDRCNEGNGLWGLVEIDIGQVLGGDDPSPYHLDVALANGRAL